MALTRWDPYSDLMTFRDMMDELFERSLVFPGRVLGRERQALTFPLDVIERDNDVIVKASLPGVKPEDVEINVVGNTVTIRGEAKSEEKVERGNYVMQERRYGMASRTITLPTPVSADKAQARFENGVLTLTLPKSEEARPKRIPIQSQKTIEGSPKKK